MFQHALCGQVMSLCSGVYSMYCQLICQAFHDRCCSRVFLWCLNRLEVNVSVFICSLYGRCAPPGCVFRNSYTSSMDKIRSSVGFGFYKISIVNIKF